MDMLTRPHLHLFDELDVNLGTPRRFYFDREVDESGISGTGLVAWGVRFSDGVCVLRWVGSSSATGVYASMDDVKKIHGHNGHTKLVWIDEP